MLQKNLGREYASEKAVAAALEVRRLLAASDGSQEAFDRLLEGIGVSLGLKSTEEALKVYYPLARYSDTNEEHQVVVLLTAAMLEELFRELLLRMLLTRGTGWEEAVGELKKLAMHDRRERRFKALTGAGLRDAVGAAGIQGFYGDWQAIRELRNTFIHGKPFAIHVSDAEKAFELAKVAFCVFAHLHNRFCVTTAAKGIGA